MSKDFNLMKDDKKDDNDIIWFEMFHFTGED